MQKASLCALGQTAPNPALSAIRHFEHEFTERLQPAAANTSLTTTDREEAAMNDIIHATINGLPVEVANGTTILEAARQVHVHIPTLCKHPDLEATAACGICIVQIKNNGKMLRACCTPIEDKMDILTETPEIVRGPAFRCLS